MQVLFLESFRDAYRRLNRAEQEAIKKAISHLKEEPGHSGLRVKKLQGRGGIWEACASRDLRITFRWSGDQITLRSCGHHAGIERM